MTTITIFAILLLWIGFSINLDCKKRKAIRRILQMTNHLSKSIDEIKNIYKKSSLRLDEVLSTFEEYASDTSIYEKDLDNLLEEKTTENLIASFLYQTQNYLDIAMYKEIDLDIPNIITIPYYFKSPIIKLYQKPIGYPYCYKESYIEY